MNVKTFQGSSIADALAKVKLELGSNAVILHTRSFKTGGVMGLGARTVVEITAGLNVNVQARRKQQAAAVASVRSRNSEISSYESESDGAATAVLEQGLLVIRCASSTPRPNPKPHPPRRDATPPMPPPQSIPPHAKWPPAF